MPAKLPGRDRFRAFAFSWLLLFFFGFFLLAGLEDGLPRTHENLIVATLGLAGVAAGTYLLFVAIRGIAPDWLADFLETTRGMRL